MSDAARGADPRLLPATFQHAPGVGETSERRLWEAGLHSWRAALDAPRLPISPAKTAALLPVAAASVDALERGDARWFARALPPREHWRLAPHFADRVAFVDIETNGGYEADDITVIGLYDGFESQIFVKGRDLDAFPAAVADAQLLVTFFGTGFDLPFLRRRFPDLPLDQPHIDLCPALRRLGYTGGLKAIEQRLRIRRTDEVEGLSGMDAVHLWNQWERRRDETALRTLLAYNRADIENMELLLAFALPRLTAASGFPG